MTKPLRLIDVAGFAAFVLAFWLTAFIAVAH